jgi:plasmid rolling circle replication initiator protein Rep
MNQSESSFELVSDDKLYLTDFSIKDKPWDIHRSEADQVKNLYRGTAFDRYAERIDNCSGLLEFSLSVDSETGETKPKLKAARFCRVRHCPVCQWRRSLVWRARFFQALPKIRKEYPTSRFLFLTLTVRNCELSELRSCLGHMKKSWERLSKRKQFPALGWLKSVEVTKSTDGTAHPHFHVLLMVNASYFSHGYLSQEKWTELWKESLRVDYTPIVNIKVVRPAKGSSEQELGDQLAKALCETLKYSVKPGDLVADQDWLLELTSQLHKTRAVAVGAVFKNFLSEEEPEDFINVDEENETESEEIDSICFGWREFIKRYVKCKSPE